MNYMKMRERFVLYKVPKFRVRCIYSGIPSFPSYQRETSSTERETSSAQCETQARSGRREEKKERKKERKIFLSLLSLSLSYVLHSFLYKNVKVEIDHRLVQFKKNLAV